ncbi:GPI mannosyltransferase 2 [Syncephalis fuscata]|nr:GPI mannosyltransferase 2 [Syncephalis fuscata]
MTNAVKYQGAPGKKMARPLTFRSRTEDTAALLAIFSLALASHRYISDYDASVDTLLNHHPSETTATAATIATKLLEPWIRPFASVYLRWDAFYFLHIAEEGYLFEQEHAFFPLLPGLVRLLAATVFYPLHYVLSHRMVLLMSGIVISNLSFILAACSLYRLSIAVFNDRRFAFLSAALFCLAPSAMFMSSIYTESLFSLLSFAGMELFMTDRLWLAAFIWCLSSLTRSNGIIYVGFFIYELLIHQTRLMGTKYLFTRCIKSLALSVIVISGMASFQIYGYQQYCNGEQSRPWCKERVPLLYSFVQTEYWNCGFLRYFEKKQLPNFALAAPMILLSAMGIIAYTMHDPIRMLTLGFITTQDEPLINSKENLKLNGTESPMVSTTVEALRHRTTNTTAEPSPPIRTMTITDPSIVDGILPEPLADYLARTRLYYSPRSLPFIYLWAVLLLYGFTSMHVQVITRFFSSMPTVFWYAAHICLRLGNPSSSLSNPMTNGGVLNENHAIYRQWNQSNFWSRAILMYFVGYGLCGVVLFSNFFPPA